MEFDFFYIEIGSQKKSLISYAIAELEELNFERLITANDKEEIEAISNYNLTSQNQVGVSHRIIEEYLFLAQIDQLIDVLDWFGELL